MFNCSFFRLPTHIVISCLAFCIADTSFAQVDLGIPFAKKGVMILNYNQADSTIRIDIGENEFGEDEIIWAKLSDSFSFLDKKGESAVLSDPLPGHEVTVIGEKLVKEFVVTEIRLKEGLDERKVSISGVYEKYDPEREEAIVSGNIIKLVGEIDGAEQWKKRKFNSFGKMMLGSFVDISGRRGVDGIVYANSGKTRPNLKSTSERALQLALKLVIKALSGSIQIGIDNYSIIENDALNTYVNQVGQSVVPAWIKNMDPENPNKIEFSFVIIDDPTFNAIAFPDGRVIIHSGLLKELENEAQLAAVLGHEIAHITNEHGNEKFEKERRKRRNRKMIQRGQELFQKAGGLNLQQQEVELAGMKVNLGMMLQFGEGVLSNIYDRNQENEADRIGLSYMFDAGYDPMEALAVWRAAEERARPSSDFENILVEEFAAEAQKQAENFLYASHPEARARYKNLNRVIATNYSTIDISGRKVGAEAFKAATASLR